MLACADREHNEGEGRLLLVCDKGLGALFELLNTNIRISLALDEDVGCRTHLGLNLDNKVDAKTTAERVFTDGLERHKLCLWNKARCQLVG